MLRHCYFPGTAVQATVISSIYSFNFSPLLRAEGSFVTRDVRECFASAQPLPNTDYNGGFLVFSSLGHIQYLYTSLPSSIFVLSLGLRDVFRYKNLRCYDTLVIPLLNVNVENYKLRGLGLRANYTDRATAAFRRS
jgi:hypothetical protein